MFVRLICSLMRYKNLGQHLAQGAHRGVCWINKWPQPAFSTFLATYSHLKDPCSSQSDSHPQHCSPHLPIWGEKLLKYLLRSPLSSPSALCASCPAPQSTCCPAPSADPSENMCKCWYFLKLGSNFPQRKNEVLLLGNLLQNSVLKKWGGKIFLRLYFFFHSKVFWEKKCTLLWLY